MRSCTSLVSFGLVTLLTVSLHGQPLPDPIIYYPFDSPDFAGGDFSGSGNSGVLLGGAVLGGTGSGRTGDSEDRALDLGNYNNGAYVDVPSAATGGFDSVVENDTVTLSLWTFGNEQQPVAQWGFRAAGPDSDRMIGSHNPWSDGTIYFDTAGTPADCCGPTHRISSPAPAPEDFMGQWNHFAFLKDGPLTAVYLNGDLLVDSGTNEMAPLREITQFVLGASFGGGGSYGGLYDDFALFDVALSPSQIASIAAGDPIPGISMQGDFDNSGGIDENDFQILATNLGAHLSRNVSHMDGDFDLNGAVNLHDFRFFKAAFPGALTTAAGVPEPASAVLVVLAIGTLLPLALRRARRS